MIKGIGRALSDYIKMNVKNVLIFASLAVLKHK